MKTTTHDPSLPVTFVLVLLMILVFSLPSLAEQTADTAFFAIDMKPVYSMEGIVVLCTAPLGDNFMRILSVDANSGAQIGPTVNVTHPPSPCMPPDPFKVLLSTEIMPDNAITLAPDLGLMHLPVTFGRDGTPSIGSWTCDLQLEDPSVFGDGMAITEMSGASFADLQPRLFVGTDLGNVFVLTTSIGGGLVVENIFLVGSGLPIKDLAPIPQYGFTALGVAAGSSIFGIIDPELSPTELFRLNDPLGDPIVSFTYPSPGPPTDPADLLTLALVDGFGNGIKMSLVSASATGNTALNYYPDPGPPGNVATPIVQIKSGSLLMLSGDSSGVWYDPSFTDSTGPGNCAANVVDNLPDNCLSCCDMAGDSNNDGATDISDLTYTVAFMFTGGPYPVCPDEGDVNADCVLDISDLTDRVCFMFLDCPVLQCGCVGK